MLGAALASWYHWRQVGEPKNFSISDWQVSRVLAVLGEGSLARRYGEMALTWATDHDLAPFYVAMGHEAIARAAAVAGNATTRDNHLGSARALAAQVEDVEDRRVVLDDLATIS